MRRQFLESDAIPNSSFRPDSFPAFSESQMERMTENRIYVGLNDSESRTQRFETDKYVDVLKNICKSYHVAFSVDIEEGGYYHDDGEYTEENTLVLVLINTERDLVREIAKDLCVFFHQESVLITEECKDGFFLREEAIGIQTPEEG